MTTLGSLRMALLQIRQRLIQHPVLLRGHGVPRDDASYRTEIAELDRLANWLALILRDLKSHGHMLNARERGLWNIPRERRWVDASRLRQQDAELAGVLELAAEVQRLLEDIIRKSGLVSSADAVANIGELIDKLYHQAHTGHLVGDLGGGPVYAPYRPGQFEASPESAVIMVFVALTALKQLLKRGGSAAAGGR